MAIHLDVEPASGTEVWRRGLEEANQGRTIQRLWERDHTLWSRYPVGVLDRLGWLDAPEAMRAHVAELRAFVDELRSEGATKALIVGMGGASLAAEMLREAYGVRDGHLEVEVVDSTHPDELEAVLARIRPESTVLVLSMKAWALESYALFVHLYQAFVDVLGVASTNRRVVVITDPDAWVLPFARRHGFGRVFVNDPFVGGRYAAHTYVGLLPAALLGIDLDAYLERAASARERCRPGAEKDSPFGTALGGFVGDFANAGRNKITFFAPLQLGGFVGWLEQLLAESLGKDGQGVVPVIGNTEHPADCYGDDRTFVMLSVGRSATRDVPLGHGNDVGERDRERYVNDLERRGHPVVRLRLDDVTDLAGLCFVWMVATAVAGSRMGVQPFDQPNVEATKVRTTGLLHGDPSTAAAPTTADEETGQASHDPWLLAGDADAGEVARAVAAFVRQIDARGYLAVQAFVPRSRPVMGSLTRLVRVLERATDRPVTAGIGPRFLHSTGQLHKGDAGRGRCIQITATGRDGPPVRTTLEGTASDYDFGTLLRAQATGDAAALREAGRAVLRIHLAGDPESALRSLATALSDVEATASENAGADGTG